MALPTGQISMSEVNVELGLSATAQISLNDAAVRTLAGVPSGQISMSNLQGKSNERSFTVQAYSPQAGIVSDGYYNGAYDTAIFSGGIYVVYTLGVDNPSIGQNVYVAQYSLSGSLNWINQYFYGTGPRNTDGTGFYNKFINPLCTTDSSGNLYFTVNYRETDYGNEAWAITKINTSGSVIYSKRVGPTGANAMEYIHAIGVDASGNLYAGCEPNNQRQGAFMLNSSGNMVWSTEVWTAGVTSSTSTFAMAVGNGYVYGARKRSGGSGEIGLFGVNSSGTLSLTTVLALYTFPTSMTVAPNGQVYLSTAGGTSNIFAKYSSSLSYVAGSGVRLYTETTTPYTRKISFDSSNNAYMAMELDNRSKLLVAKYNDSTTLQWIRTFNETGTQYNNYTTRIATGTNRFMLLGRVDRGGGSVFNYTGMATFRPNDGSNTGAVTLNGMSYTYAVGSGTSEATSASNSGSWDYWTSASLGWTSADAPTTVTNSASTIPLYIVTT